MAQRVGLRKLSKTLDIFRGMDSDLPTQVIDVFLSIAQRDEVYTRDLPDMVGLSQSSVNRAVTYLADAHWRDRNKPGLKLISMRIDPMDRRQRIVQLTARGKHVATQLEEILDG